MLLGLPQNDHIFHIMLMKIEGQRNQLMYQKSCYYSTRQVFQTEFLQCKKHNKDGNWKPHTEGMTIVVKTKVNDIDLQALY